MKTCVKLICTLSVADPGFPRGGGTNPPGEAPTYNFAKFSQKLHEIERIWTLGAASKILLCRSATGHEITENKLISQSKILK